MDLYIPKFSMSEAYDFRGLLKNISLADLLTHQENFSGITQETQLKLSKVNVSGSYHSPPIYLLFYK